MLDHQPAAGRVGVQTSLGDLGTPLADVTFVVVDLETTGGRPEAEGITEIGAVKVRGGEIIGEFATLVDPGAPIPIQIQRLTGITTSMVHDAPRIAGVLPAFLAFLGPDSVLVAHNAPFDVGFLRAACLGHDMVWPKPPVVDTVKLARALVPRDEAPNHRLGTLAALFASTTTPNHRALADARATVDVLHALLGRLGSLGVTSLEDLLTFSGKVPARRRRKSTLADALPQEPGVYVFRDEAGTPLYVGTSGNIQRRVRSYFTAAEKRRGMGLMVDLAQSVTPIPCATAIEAHVREIRLIAEHRPRFNRRSTRPEKVAWLKITDERFPRLSVVRKTKPDGATYVGPFRSATAAHSARDLVHDVRRIRQCTQTITARGTATSCVLAQLGRCDAPCLGSLSPEQYAPVVAEVRHGLTHGTGAFVSDVEARLARLAAQERFEEARAVRDNLLELLRGTDRHQRHQALVSNPGLTAARPRAGGGWEFVVVRHGRLAGSAVAERGADPRPVIASLELAGEVVSAPAPNAACALPEETDVVLRWLERPGTRVVETATEWVSPVGGAGRALAALDPLVHRAWEQTHPPQHRSPA